MRRDPMTLAAAAALLLLFASLSAWEMAGDSLTADERVHLPAGYAYWKTRDFRLNPEHPPLVKLLCAAPLLAMDLRLPATEPDPGKSWRSFQATFGTRFLFGQKQRADRILLLGRLPALLLALLLLALLFSWSWEMHGQAGAGLLTLSLAALEPTILAHGHYVTDDVGLACFSVMAFYFLWRFLRTAVARDLVLAASGMGLALATKFSAIILVPVFFWLLWRRWPAGGLLPAGRRAERRAAQGGGRAPRAGTADPRRQRLLAVAAAALGMAAIVQAAYLFSLDPTLYYEGLRALRANRPAVNPAYIHGTFHKDMVFWYPIYAWIVKTPLPALAAVGIAVAALVRRGRRRAGGGHAPRDLALVLAPAAALLSTVCLLAYNYGVRYLIPVTSFLFVLAGAAFAPLAAGRRARDAGMVLGAWLVLSVTHASPHYIGYFNEIVGGPADGLYYLQDSNLDWGQDLKRLARWQKEKRAGEIALGYWGPTHPDYYGIAWRPWVEEETLAGHPPSGVYAISVNDLIALRRRVQLEGADPRLDWLSRFTSVDRVGCSILIYRFR